MKTPTITIGLRLQLAREGAGLKVTDMARRLGVTRQTITRYEHNQTPVPEAVLIAYQVICDVTEDFIRGREALTQEVVTSRCTGECPRHEPYDRAA